MGWRFLRSVQNFGGIVTHRLTMRAYGDSDAIVVLFVIDLVILLRQGR
jgi:hypothetical protein